ncbi:MAG TPA: PQQ-dependent sugar dehydrogenase, partial [Candidatus Woesebacteria bacterium]|nr:PQQ-dependent sugar dehydrogenase [Candidatus Woesebacteria bacterium]
MKYIILVGLLLFGIVAVYFYFSSLEKTDNKKQQVQTITSHPDAPEIQIIAEGLDTPWSLVFLPDNSLLVTERKGTVRKISANGQLDVNPVATLPNVLEIGEGGLLGMTLHPNFETNNYIYFYYTYRSNGNNTLNRVVRMTYTNNILSNEEILVNEIPGASNHNGGRIKFGPDNFLYITTGDAEEPSQAQNTNSLAGKILRVTDTGEPAPENPFNNRVYSYGHRNPQGLAWDTNGKLWSTEHGRSGIQSGLDEVNLIQAGKNYG